jgi:hypothetical protein
MMSPFPRQAKFSPAAHTDMTDPADRQHPDHRSDVTSRMPDLHSPRPVGPTAESA